MHVNYFKTNEVQKYPIKNSLSYLIHAYAASSTDVEKYTNDVSNQ